MALPSCPRPLPVPGSLWKVRLRREKVSVRRSKDDAVIIASGAGAGTPLLHGTALVPSGEHVDALLSSRLNVSSALRSAGFRNIRFSINQIADGMLLLTVKGSGLAGPARIKGIRLDPSASAEDWRRLARRALDQVLSDAGETSVSKASLHHLADSMSTTALARR